MKFPFDFFWAAVSFFSFVSDGGLTQEPNPGTGKGSDIPVSLVHCGVTAGPLRAWLHPLIYLLWSPNTDKSPSSSPPWDPHCLINGPSWINNRPPPPETPNHSYIMNNSLRLQALLNVYMLYLKWPMCFYDLYPILHACLWWSTWEAEVGGHFVL